MIIQLAPTIVMALQLDDESVIRNFHLTPKGMKGKMTLFEADPKVVAELVDELTVQTSAEYDTPFYVKGACAKTARRLHAQVQKETGR